MRAKKARDNCIKPILRFMRKNDSSVVEGQPRDGSQRLKRSDEDPRDENGGLTRVKGAKTQRISETSACYHGLTPIPPCVVVREMDEIDRAVRLVDDA